MYQENGYQEDYTDPFKVLAKSDPLVAVAIELSAGAARSSTNSNHVVNKNYELESQVKDYSQQLTWARRRAEEAEEALEVSNSKLEKLEKKLKPKVAKKKGKK